MRSRPLAGETEHHSLLDTCCHFHFSTWHERMPLGILAFEMTDRNPQAAWQCLRATRRATWPVPATLRNERLTAFRRWSLVFAVVCTSVIGGASVTAAAEAGTNIPAFVVKSWQTMEGLPQNSVTAIAQTPDGYLWVGTRGGLARFDGVRFRNYGLADGLRGLSIRVLLGDGQGGLWIATRGGGLSRWRDGVISTLTTADGLAHEDVLSLAPAEPGAVWIGTRRGLQHWGPDGFKRVGEAEGVRGPVFGMAASPAAGLWFNLENVGLFHCQGGRCEFVEPVSKSRGLFPSSFFADAEGTVWIGMGNGVVLRRQAGAWKEFNQTNGVPFSYIYCFAQGPSGEIWAGSHEEGLYVFREGCFHAVPGTDVSTRSIQVSRDGVVWVGTQTGGLSRLTRPRVTSYPVRQESRRGQINGLVEDPPGQFWVTTFGGGLFRGTLDALEPELSVKDLIDSPFLSAGVRMRDGTVFLAGQKRLWRKEAGTGEIRGTKLADNPRALCEDAGGSLWLGTYEGELKRLVDGAPQAVTNGMFPAPITALVSGKGPALWVATQGEGLFRWEAGQVQRWTTVEGLPTKILLSLYQDADGTLWIGTAGGGLVWLKDGRVRSVNTWQGLGDNVISQILDDDQGNLWLGSNLGIFRVSKRELQDVAAGRLAAVHPLALDESDGMSVAECTGGYSPAGLRSRSGKLCFSTVRSVAVVDPAQFGPAPSAPTVLIEEVKLDGKTIPMRGGVLFLPPGPRELQIDYTAFNYAKPEQIRFRYRLEGGKEQWEEVNRARSVRFSQLRPGDYTFQVSAANQDGRWHETGASLAFTVQPSYWQTTWFRVVVVLLLIASGGGAVWRLVRARLRRAEFRKAILDSMGAHIAVLDAHGMIVAVNARWRQFALENPPSFGEPARNIGIGINYLEICRQCSGESAESAKAAHDGILAVIEGRMKSFSLEYACHSPQQQRWFSMNVTPLGLTGQSVVASHVDITERKRIEEANRNAHELMAAVFNSVPGLLYLYTEDGRLVQWNRQHEEMTGYTAEELLNFPIADWFEKEERIKLIKEFSKIFSEGYTQVELNLPLKNGQKMPVFATGSKLIIDGKPHMVGIAVDISARKKAEESLRASEARYRDIFEGAIKGIYRSSLQGEIMAANPALAKMLGYDSPEDLVRAVQDTGSQVWADLTERAQFVRLLEERRVVRAYECQFKRKDGTNLWVSLNSRVVRDPAGRTAYLEGFIEDITERKRAELELQAQRDELAHLSRVTMLGELSGSLAHELNQPLTAILSNAQAAQRFLAQDTPDLAELRDILTDIVTEDKRAGEVIRRLRLLLKKSEFQHQPLDLNDVVREVLKLVRNDLVNRGVSVQTDLAFDPPSISGDRVQLQQVLINMVMNACHAMTETVPADRAIVLRTRASESEGVRVEIADGGCGILPENLERIFDPFFTTRPEGMGMGLAVCRTIIDAHGGKMGARNNAERGATFYFTIPAQAEPSL